MKSLKWLAVCAALGACDAPKPADPVPVPEPVKAEPPPPPKFDVPAAMVAVDQKTLCGLFLRAASDAKTKIAKGDCVVTPGASDITVTTKDGSSSLSVVLVEAGSVISLTAANASPRAVAHEDTGLFSNVGMLFVGKAPATGLCLAIEYSAPDVSSNSLFVGSDPKTPPERFDVAVTAGQTGKGVYAKPVVAPNQIAAFAMTRREDKLGVKSATFSACS